MCRVSKSVLSGHTNFLNNKLISEEVSYNFLLFQRARAELMS